MDNTDPDNQVTKISFYSPSHGYVAFTDWIGFTADSGRTFTRKYITLSNVNYGTTSVNLTFGFWIQGIKAFSQNSLLVYGHYGLEPTILYSNNGGSSYVIVYHENFNLNGPNGGITDMVFPEGNSVGYAVNSHAILKTTNGGMSWSRRDVSPGNFTSLTAVNNNTVFATSSPSNFVLKTTDGSNWSLMTLPPGSTTYSIKIVEFVSANVGWIVLNSFGNGYLTYSTSNGGANWTLLNNPNIPSLDPTKLKFLTPDIGFALSNKETGVYKTINAGSTWERLEDENRDGYFMEDLFFIDNNQFWAGGDHGFLQMTTNGGGVPIPRALFFIDTLGVSSTNTVRLQNLSNPSYSVKWFKNDTLISTSYNATYTHRLFQAVDTIKLVVTNGNRSDSSIRYQYFTLPPLPAYPGITSFSPTSGATGDVITITGTNLINVQSVLIGNTPARSFSMVSPTTLKAEVGEGASGNIVVTTQVGTAVKSGFTYFTKLKITSVSPQAGPVGTIVTISGTDFDPGNNTVYFGTVKVTVLSATTNQLIVKVPPGVNHRPISVTCNGLTTYSKNPFVVTFPDGGNITTTSFPGKTDFGSRRNAYVIAADIDGDGKQDIITTQFDANGYIEVSRNISDINVLAFASPVRLTGSMQLGHQLRDKIVVVDLNGDGKLDLVANENIYQNNSTPGQISFAARQFLTPGIAPHHMSTADLNNDGKPDLIGISGSNRIVIYQNTGMGGAISFVNLPMLNMTDIQSGDCTVGDINEDGKPDILYTNANGPGVKILPNTSVNGIISFETPYYPPSLPLSGASYYSNIRLADLDGDKRLDVAISNNPGEVLVFRNTTQNGSVSFAPSYSIPISAYDVLDIADMNGDGKPDICTAVNASEVYPGNDVEASVVQNNSTNGNLSFAPATLLAYEPVNHNTISLTVTDFDGDGKPDIALNEVPDKFTVLLNNSGDSTLVGCQGSSGVLHATVNGTSYRWQENSGNGFVDMSDNADVTGTTSRTLVFNTFSTSHNGNRYRCVVNGNGGKTYVLKVNPIVPISIIISQSATSICAGTPVTFSAQATNGGPSPFYQWKVNGNVMGSGTSFTTSSLQNADQIQAVLTTSSACAATSTAASNILTIAVTPVPTNSVSISGSATSICAGQTVNFSATPVNGGVNPSFQWYVNNAPQAGQTSITFSSSTLTGNAFVKLVMQAGSTCALPVQSNVVIVNVTPLVTPIVSMSVSPGLIVCKGVPVTFNAIHLDNQGPNPSFQWKKNGINVGTNSTTYIDNDIQNKDIVNVIMTSSAQCLTRPSSEVGFEMTVNAGERPTATIAGRTTINQGDGTALNVTVTNNGSNPVYQWQDSSTSTGWQNIAGATGTGLNYYPITSGNKVRCLLTSTNNCASPATVTVSSNVLVITLNTVTAVTTIPGVAYGLRLYPNPVTDYVNIEPLRLNDNWQSVALVGADGRQVWQKSIIGLTKLSFDVKSLSPGIYLVLMKNRAGNSALLNFIKLDR